MCPAGPERDSPASFLSASPCLYPQTLTPDRHLCPDLWWIWANESEAQRGQRSWGDPQGGSLAEGGGSPTHSGLALSSAAQIFTEHQRPGSFEVSAGLPLSFLLSFLPFIPPSSGSLWAAPKPSLSADLTRAHLLGGPAGLLAAPAWLCGGPRWRWVGGVCPLGASRTPLLHHPPASGGAWSFWWFLGLHTPSASTPACTSH